jgi:hypothetical protein
MMITTSYLTCLARNRDRRWTSPITWPAWLEAMIGDEHLRHLTCSARSRVCHQRRHVKPVGVKPWSEMTITRHISWMTVTVTYPVGMELCVAIEDGIIGTHLHLIWPLRKELHLHLICPPHSPYSDCFIGGELRRRTPPQILTTCTLDLWCVGFGGRIRGRWFSGLVM